LAELVDAVFSSIAIPANIILIKEVADDFPQIKADLQLLKRVLINLLTNALQAMPNGGKLTLHSQVNSDGQVLVSVEDTGIGIPEKIKPQIFTPLFTTKPRGQGFGLAVCKRVIEAHGGTISFESQEGKGAKFTIQFQPVKFQPFSFVLQFPSISGVNYRGMLRTRTQRSPTQMQNQRCFQANNKQFQSQQ